MPDLPTGTRECLTCGKRMIADWDGLVCAFDPPRRSWTWFCCGCGRSAPGKSVPILTPGSSDRYDRWKAANPDV